MSERDAELRELTTDLREHEGVADAYLAKRSTDRLVIVDVDDADAVPTDVEARLSAHGLCGAVEVDEDDEDDEHGSFAGGIPDATRHHFVDLQTRYSHRSHVVD